jgi:hypothetical protein
VRFAYADPPYPGMSHFYKDHPDYGGEVNHAELIERLEREYDGWILHTASTTMLEVWALCPDARPLVWVKPFASFKKNVTLAYAWEPVLVKGWRKRGIDRPTVRDWFAENITLERGLTGAKPERVCHWLFEAMGMETQDELHDLFPGSGAVTRAWDSWRTQPQLRVPPSEQDELPRVA